MSESAEIMYIVNRPFYRVVILVNGADVDVNIILTSRGKQYAKGRAHSKGRRTMNDDEAIAEIMAARDSYVPALVPSSNFSFDI